MAELEDIVRGFSIRGILPDALVTVLDVKWIGTIAIEVTYKDSAGRLGSQLLYRDREPRRIDADPQHRGKRMPQMVHEIHLEWKAIIATGEGPRSFLSAENRCGIYPTRPNCVALQGGDEQWKEARAAQGLPPFPLQQDAADPGAYLEHCDEAPRCA